MELRRAAPLVFAALCLGLSGMVLHRQIAAHPLPPAGAEPTGPPPGVGEPANPRRTIGLKPWHVTTGPARRAVLTVIGSQLAAIRTGDADAAWFYQSRPWHRSLHTARGFESEIVSKYPEFGHSKSAAFGPVITNAAGNKAEVIVTVLGQNGRHGRAAYRLVREESGYKVDSVLVNPAITPAASRPQPGPRGTLEHSQGPTGSPRPR